MSQEQGNNKGRRKTYRFEMSWQKTKEFKISAPAELSEQDLADLLDDYEDTLRDLCRHTPMPLILGCEEKVRVERVLKDGTADEGPWATYLEADNA
ncbi:MAG: hypothetical protein AB7E32_17160 [Desulfovibrio sp.]